MADEVATLKKQRRGGDKIAQHELAARLEIVEDLMTAGMPTRKIVAELHRQRKWTESTIYRYVVQVRERWVAERATERITDVELSLARLTMLSFKAEREKAWSAVRGFEQLIADIRGVRAPEKHDHRVAAIVQPAATSPAAIPLDIVDDAPDELLDYLERKADERAARGALPPHVIDAHAD